MRAHHLLGPVLVALLAVPSHGCGQEDGGPGALSDCAVELSVSGDLKASLADGDAGCATGLSSDAGVGVTYVAVNGGSLKGVDLTIGELTRGATGEGFAASLRIFSSNDRMWQASDCLVDVEIHESRGPSDFGEDYRVAGSGTCPSPAINEDGSSVTIAPFQFSVIITWRE